MLHGKVCLVTGAGSGMGQATAIEMARQGAKAVILCDVNVEAARNVADIVMATGAEALAVYCDVSASSEVAAMMANIEAQFGYLDVLHNNAGIVDAQATNARNIYELDETTWDRVFDVNVKGSWLCIKHAKSLLEKSRSGVIVNCASISSFLHFEAESAYVASKSAILGLTRTAAVDLAPFGIRCVAYAPGTIDTPMNTKIINSASNSVEMERSLTATHLVRRLGHPEDIAKLVCFLASDEASFITGSVHVIDGGVLAWRGSNS